MAPKPGVIPLRPLTLSDIFNGAVGYVRANPKATLGLTTVVVVISQLLAIVLQVGPLAITGRLGVLQGDEASTTALLGSSISSVAGGVTTGLAAILLSGMLTVVVGRAVFGSGITIGEAWQRVRGRLWALLGLTVLEVFGAIALIGLVALIIFGIMAASNGAIAAIIGIPLGLAMIAALVYLLTMLTFAPVAVVLERKPVFTSMSRSFALVRRYFWRVLGIRLLAVFVAGVIAGAVAVPFGIAGGVLSFGPESTASVLIATVLASIGSAIGQIVTTPFTAGVVALLYTDTRIRAEAFDLVLQGGLQMSMTGGPAAAASTDDLWLTRPI